MNDVDSLIENTPLDLVLQHYGLPLSQSGSREYRMKCVFNAAACSDNQYGNLAIKLDAAKRIYCHACQTAGNLLTLLHGLETGRPPISGRLRGQEFKAAAAKLREINGLVESPASAPSVPQKSVKTESPLTPLSDVLPNDPEIKNETLVSTVNVPLRRHDKEAARALADLHKELVTDVSLMSPEAAAYVRKRPWMTEEVMKKWGVGWIPGNGRSLFRKNYFVYTHRDIRSDVISYSGRDLTFESKWQRWLKEGKPEGKKPNKHRYVSGFHRGSELYGGQASRLEEDYIKESLAKYGLVIVEGMNDVIRMDELGVAAVGICSNKATGVQIRKLVQFAQRTKIGRVLLLPDCDEEGESGFKGLLWTLSEYALDVGVGISRNMYGSRFNGFQPENLSKSDFEFIKNEKAFHGENVYDENAVNFNTWNG
jgi:5S rRNA maturation endonuclease (ribonuclease M5)